MQRQISTGRSPRPVAADEVARLVVAAAFTVPATPRSAWTRSDWRRLEPRPTHGGWRNARSPKNAD